MRELSERRVSPLWCSARNLRGMIRSDFLLIVSPNGTTASSRAENLGNRGFDKEVRICGFQSLGVTESEFDPFHLGHRHGEFAVFGGHYQYFVH